MLTGRRAFDGEDVADTLAAVVRGAPDWTALPTGTSGRLCAEILEGCLQKDRKGAHSRHGAVVRFSDGEARAV